MNIHHGLAELVQDSLEELCHQVVVVHENLQQIFNAHDLLWAELEPSILLPLELLPTDHVVYHRLNDAEGYVADIFGADDAFVAICHERLVFAFLEEAWPVRLQQVNFLPHIIDLGIDDHQGLFVPALLLGEDLHDQLPSVALLGKLDR